MQGNLPDKGFAHLRERPTRHQSISNPNSSGTLHEGSRSSVTAKYQLPRLPFTRAVAPLRAGRATLLACLLLWVGTSADASDVDALLRHFASRPGFSAEFRELKRMELLVDPLISTGELYFSPPDLLARHTSQPTPSTLIIQGEELRFGEGGALTRIDLASNPTLRTFVDSFRALLAGDAEALRTDFAINYQSGSDAEGLPGPEEIWEIRLAPLRSPLREQITRIALRGTGLLPRDIFVLEASGDETLTHLGAVNTERTFSPAESNELFHLTDQDTP